MVWNKLFPPVQKMRWSLLHLFNVNFKVSANWAQVRDSDSFQFTDREILQWWREHLELRNNPIPAEKEGQSIHTWLNMIGWEQTYTVVHQPEDQQQSTSFWFWVWLLDHPHLIVWNFHWKFIYYWGQAFWQWAKGKPTTTPRVRDWI